METITITAAVVALLAPAATVPAPSPLIGTWTQVEGFHCVGLLRAGTEPWTPRAPLGELVFKADGRFAVTYEPFESYIDYWGTWRADRDGTLVLTIEGGNTTTDYLDPEGRFEVSSDGRLHLTDMWLGSSREHGCGATFAPARSTGPAAS